MAGLLPARRDPGGRHRRPLRLRRPVRPSEGPCAAEPVFPDLPGGTKGSIPRPCSGSTAGGPFPAGSALWQHPAVNDVSVVLTVAGPAWWALRWGSLPGFSRCCPGSSFSFAQLNVTALRLAMGHLPATFLGLGTMGTVYLCLRFAVRCFDACSPGLPSFPIERAFRPYMEETNHA